MSHWKNTEDELPPELVKVMTMDSSGHVQPLIRKGRLWFFPDMSSATKFMNEKFEREMKYEKEIYGH